MSVKENELRSELRLKRVYLIGLLINSIFQKVNFLFSYRFVNLSIYLLSIEEIRFWG
jgi:hypothetical protein